MGFLFGGGGAASQTETRIGNLQVQQTGYGVTIPVVMGTNRVAPTLIYYSDFVATAHSSGGGKGLGGGSSGKSYTYTASIMLLVCEGGSGVDFGTLWVNKKRYNAVAEIGFVAFNGQPGQAPWGYLTTKHPDDALAYKGFAYIAAANYALTNSASIGNHGVEVKGFYRDAVDASVRNCMVGVLTNTQWSLGFDAGRVDAMNLLDSYCSAYGIVISPALTEQKKAADILKQFAMIANCGIIWSGGKFKCIPYSDSNYGSFMAEPTTGVHLTDADFIAGEDEDPVRIMRKLKADAYNQVTVEYLARGHNYDVRTATASDDADIEQFGLRPMPTVTLHEICLESVANTVARQILQRALYIENTYEFNLSFNYALLEAMDVVFITDELCGIIDAPVRIIKIKDAPDGLRTITAEEMPWGASHTEAYPVPKTAGYVPVTNISVGPVNPPVIFIAPPQLTVSSYQIWIALSNPDANYGGCVVWSSFDDASYTRRSTFYGRSTHGVLTTGLIAGTDPDTNPAHALAVDLSVSGGTLSSTANDDWALCLAGHEFIGYRFATLTGPHQYNVFSPVPPATAPYLRRGLYGSTQGAAVGDRFVLCNDDLVKLPFTSDDIGKTIYLKFQSFNVFNDGLEDLAAVSAYRFTLTAPASGGNFPVIFDNMWSDQ